MHYILGTEILIPEQRTIQQGQGPQPINAQQVQTKVKNNTPFTSGVPYTLHNIRPSRDENNNTLFEYTFIDPSGNTIPVPFPSVADAEKFISSIRGESIPNYEHFHLRRRD
jgi:hypothetical protein